jgi:hypothetical protein
MAESITSSQIAITPGSGQILDAVQVTVSATAVQREVTVIGDPGNPSQYAEVTSKGTQADNAIGVQELKDSGRTQVTLWADSLTGITTEALATLQITKGLVTQTAATAYTITSGKTFRIQSVRLSCANSTSTAVVARARVRVGATVSAASAVVFDIKCPAVTAVALEGQSVWGDIPDGIEIPSGNQIGISHIESSAVVGSTTTGAGVSFLVCGFEY